jgi:hypothetical protein
VINTIVLLAEFAFLVGFMVWRRVPRRYAFDILHASAWIFVAAYFLCWPLVDKISSRVDDGPVQYLPPVIPVAIFVAWALRKAKRDERQD